MKITKYEHACLVVEEQGKRLVIDPGKFSISFAPEPDTVAVVITHIHNDHFDPDHISAIKELNPSVRIFSTHQVSASEGELNIEPVQAGQEIEVEGFKLKFYGGQHELFADTENIAVLVNDTLLHPGDSYTKADKPVKVLAAPASAPWLRVTEASQFIKDVQPSKVFPIHNALLSEIGESIHYRILSGAAAEAGSEWLVLKPGESLEVNS